MLEKKIIRYTSSKNQIKSNKGIYKSSSIGSYDRHALTFYQLFC